MIGRLVGLRIVFGFYCCSFPAAVFVAAVATTKDHAERVLVMHHMQPGLILFLTMAKLNVLFLCGLPVSLVTADPVKELITLAACWMLHLKRVLV